MCNLNQSAPADRTQRSFSWRANLLLAAVVLSFVLTVYFWATGDGVREAETSPDDLAESMALLTGMLAMTCMSLQVFMLARIPWVEKSWGHDVLANRHRVFGYWSFWFLIAHVVLFAISRIATPGSDNPLAQLYYLFVKEPWMLITTLGTLMLIMVVVTSIRVARSRLRYESWHLIHLYSYVGLILTFPHRLLHGQFEKDLGLQVFLWVMFLAPLVAVLVYRVGLPAYRSWRHRLRVREVVTEAPGVASITIEGRDLDRLPVKSGQFFIWRFLGSPGWTRANPYSLSAAPSSSDLRITVKASGDGSARTASISPGSTVLIEGPYGTVTQEVRRHPKMLMLAAGVGITPFAAMLADADYRPGEATLIYRLGHLDHAIHLDELRELADGRGLVLHVLPGPPRNEHSWLPPETTMPTDESALLELVPDIADRDVFVCGPLGWNHLVHRSLQRVGVHKRDIHIEDYSW